MQGMPDLSIATPAPAETRISVRVLLFATYAELVGQESLTLTLRVPATVASAVSALRSSLPHAGGIPDRPLAAVNRVHAKSETPLAEGDELALLPPLAGG